MSSPRLDTSYRPSRTPSLPIHHALLPKSSHERHFPPRNPPPSTCTGHFSLRPGETNKAVHVLAPCCNLLTFPLALSKVDAREVRRYVGRFGVRRDENMLRSQGMLRCHGGKPVSFVSGGFEVLILQYEWVDYRFLMADATASTPLMLPRNG